MHPCDDTLEAAEAASSWAWWLKAKMKSVAALVYEGGDPRGGIWRRERRGVGDKNSA